MNSQVYGGGALEMEQDGNNVRQYPLLPTNEFLGKPDLVVYALRHTMNDGADANFKPDVRMIIEIKKDTGQSWFQGNSTSVSQLNECAQLLFYALFSMQHNASPISVVFKWDKDRVGILVFCLANSHIQRPQRIRDVGVWVDRIIDLKDPAGRRQAIWAIARLSAQPVSFAWICHVFNLVDPRIENPWNYRPFLRHLIYGNGL